jgi:hypothetical protein
MNDFDDRSAPVPHQSALVQRLTRTDQSGARVITRYEPPWNSPKALLTLEYAKRYPRGRQDYLADPDPRFQDLFCSA